MKLLVDGEIYSWHHGGGISKVFNELIPRWGRLGVEITVGVKQYTDKGRIDPAVQPYVQWIPQFPPRLRPWRLWSWVGRFINPILIRYFWAQKKADVFLSTYFTNPHVNARKVCVLYDMIFELFPHCFEAEFRKQTIQRQRGAVASVDITVCISETTREDLIRLWGIPAGRCVTIYNGGINDSTPDAPPPASPGKPFLLYVGDYRCAYKNFRFTLECLGSLAGTLIAGLDYVVVSRVGPDELEQTAFAALFPESRLRFLAGVTDGELRAYYRDCAAFICPSLYEGFGLPVQEALSQGAPVVCSNAASLPEVGGEAVYYFEPTDAAQFTSALKHALDDGRSEALVATRKAQAARFSWDKCAKEYVELFNKVTKSAQHL